MKIQYLVENASVVSQTADIPHEGGTATITFERLRVELTPVGTDSSSVILTLPVGTEGYTEGETIDATFPGKAK